MKNRIFIIAVLFFSMPLFSQEGLKLGLQGGLPFDDFNNEVSVVIGAEAGYLWALNKVVDLGATVGFLHGFAETFQSDVVVNDLPNVQFVPLAGSIRIWPSRSFSFGVDAGQGFGINDGNEGGLYYRPLIGYLMGPKTQLNASYTSISLDNRSWTTLTLGIVYTIPSKRSRF